MAKILIADDDPDCVELLSVHLQGLGHTVVGTKDGPGVLERAMWDRPDLILLDLRMPVMDGIRVIEILRGNILTANIPVILMSVLDKEWATRRLPPDPFVRFIEKPLDFAGLHTVFTELLPAAHG